MTESSDTTGTDIEPSGGRRRGPVDHQIRDQIVDAANRFFRDSGYERTTVSELAKAIGFSKAYIYKFFDSKQAIGEAICADCLERIDAAALAASHAAVSPEDRLRVLMHATMHGTLTLFSDDRRLYAIAEQSALNRWASFHAHEARLGRALEAILVSGRDAGEFCHETPLLEQARAILLALQPFLNPLMLQHGLDGSPEALSEVLHLVLRSLRPKTPGVTRGATAL
jgi:AcrR family transcriptional regulator